MLKHAPTGYMEPANLSTFWSAVFVNELYRNGLRHAVLSPGSRSTPLTMAFALHPGIESHVVLDERSAGFIALGIGMQSGKPAALVCTSGTAVANYLPSVVEAHMSGVPMLVLSADRPPNLRNIGANQAIRQSGIFGSYAIFEHDTGEPVSTPSDFRRLEILASQAWQASVNHPGTAHLNFPFRKPLEPEATFRQALSAYYSGALQEREEAVTTGYVPDWSIPEYVLKTLADSRKPVVIAGPLPQRGVLPELLNWFQESGIPVLQEAAAGTSGTLADIPGFNAYLKHASYRDHLAPDLIIRLGAAPVGKGLELYLSTHHRVKNIRFETGNAWADPFQTGGLRISIPAVAHAVELPPALVNIEPKWKQQWLEVSSDWVALRTRVLAPAPTLRDGDVYPAVLRHSDASMLFMISNSFAARDADIFGMPGLSGHRVYMNRGASGIDGITSTAAGIALSSGRPVTLITGDLAFLHDATALLTVSQLPPHARVRIIVINNGGGSIFRMLPVYEPSDWFTRYFETPQQVQLPDLSKAFGLNTVEANSVASLEAALTQDDVADVIICHTDADESMNQRQSLWNPFG